MSGAQPSFSTMSGYLETRRGYVKAEKNGGVWRPTGTTVYGSPWSTGNTFVMLDRRTGEWLECIPTAASSHQQPVSTGTPTLVNFSGASTVRIDVERMVHVAHSTGRV